MHYGAVCSPNHTSAVTVGSSRLSAYSLSHLWAAVSAGEEANHRFLGRPFLDPCCLLSHWQPIQENLALGEGEEDRDDEETDAPAVEAARRFPRKRTYLPGLPVWGAGACSCAEGAVPIYVTLHGLMKEEKYGNRVRKVPVGELKECPRCRDQSYSGTEIVTPVRMSTTTPLSILTEELYRSVPPAASPERQRRPGQGRKLLSFYDSRQGAAQFAAILQDVTNQNTYTHLIPTAVRQLESRYGYADFRSLAEQTMELALDYRIFHNDVTIDSRLLPRQSSYLELHQREKLQRPIRARILAEFTTRRRARRSLESLCLIGVYYFSPDNPPDLTSLTAKLGLDGEQLLALIGYLLDDLRSNKAVTLPEGVVRDDVLFGRNRFSPRVVGAYSQYELGWLGRTPPPPSPCQRHAPRRSAACGR